MTPAGPSALRLWSSPQVARVLAVGTAQGVRAVGSLAALPLAARLLDRAAFGRLAACLCAAQVIAVALDWGVSATGYTRLQTAGRPASAVLRQVTVFKLCVAAVLAVPVLAVSRLHGVDAPAVLSAYAYGAALSLNAFWWLNHQRRLRLALVSEGLPVVGLLVGAAALAVCRAPWWTVPLAASGGALILPLTLAGRAGPCGGGLARILCDAARPAGQLRVGLARLMVAAYTLALIPIAALRFDLRAVAAYAACDKVASVAGMLGLIAAQSLAPVMARGTGVLTLSLNAVVRIAIVATIAAVAYIAMAGWGAGGAVALVYGARYRGLEGCAFVTVLADGLVGVNTVIWSGVLLPRGVHTGFGRVTALGAVVCYAILLAPLGGGSIQIACARLGGEAAILILSIAGLASRRSPADVPALSPLQAAA